MWERGVLRIRARQVDTRTTSHRHLNCTRLLPAESEAQRQMLVVIRESEQEPGSSVIVNEPHGEKDNGSNFNRASIIHPPRNTRPNDQ